MITQPPDLKKLREVAEKATPIYTDLLGDRYFNDDYSHATLNVQQDDFVSTFNPQTILALLDAYEASARDAEALVAKWREKERQLRCGDDFNDGIAHGYDMCADALEETIAARHATQGD